MHCWSTAYVVGCVSCVSART